MNEHDPWDACNDDRDRDSLDQEQLEARVRSASNYVRPSEFFRARVLDSARQLQSDRNADHTVLRAALALACSVALTLASLHSVHEWWSERFVGRSSEQMQSRAHQIAAEQRQSLDDSLAEAYWESRADLAARWPKRERSATP